MDRLDSVMQENVRQELLRWAEEVRQEAMQLVPVRTGYLQSTIYARISDWVAEVGAEASYAAFVEFGTRYMMAQPFLYPAIQDHLPILETIIANAIEAAAVGAGVT